MRTDRPLSLLGGLTPDQFMRRHWQKKPLLVRAALADLQAAVNRRQLYALAQRDDIESRLIEHGGAAGWRLTRGPFRRNALPPLKLPGWTLLVQGVDRHHDAMHALLQRFRFIPDARLDDLMVSYASDQGGVGPHVDQYDVFLLQAQGQRRWRVGRSKDGTLLPDLPLKILASFEPDQEFLLDAGDLLYLPPGWAHEGTAAGGDCITCSIGFRAPGRAELAREVLQRLADQEEPTATGDRRYRDATQPAVAAPGAIPGALAVFARRAVEAALRNPEAIDRAVGEMLSEPDASVWFDPAMHERTDVRAPLRLDRRTRMLYDERYLYINGESLRATGRDARLLRKLADARTLDARQLKQCGPAVRACLTEWMVAGWLHGEGVNR